MSTRLYFTNDTIPYTPATIRGAWDATASPVTGHLAGHHSGSNRATTKSETNATNNWDVLFGRWVSQGIKAAMTLSGTIDYMLRVSEANADANAVFHIHIYVTQGDSDTPRGTLLTDHIGSSEFPTTAQGLGASAVAISSLAVQAGDRIVVEIGVQFQNTHTTARNTVVADAGVDGVDLVAANTTAARPKWIQFSSDFQFLNFPTMTDDFNDNSLDAAKWSDWGGANTNETNQRLEITGDTTGGNYYGVDTLNRFDMTGCYVQAQLVNPGTNHANRVGHIGVLRDTDNSLYWEYNDGIMRAYKAVAGVYTQVGSDLTYPGNNYYWRLRETGGTFYWEYSSDGVSWTTHASEATPLAVRDLYAFLELGNEGAVTSGSFFHFDNYSSGTYTPPAGVNKGLMFSVF